MNLGCTYQFNYFASGSISLLLSLAVIGHTWAADHLEIRIKLQTTWASPTATNEHAATVTCVLGTNDWYISGQFLKNARIEYWLTGTNVLEHRVITSSMYWEQTKEFISEKLGEEPPRGFAASYPAKGESYTTVKSWVEPFGYTVERAVWLGFCSGTASSTSDWPFFRSERVRG